MGNFIRVIIICAISCIFPPFFFMIFFLPDHEADAEKKLTKEYMKAVVDLNKKGI